MIKSCLTLFFAVSFSLCLTAQEVRWTPSQNTTASASTIKPTDFDVYEIDFEGLKAFLNQAPLRENLMAKNSDYIFSIPTPTGETWDFKIVESPVMAPELQERYPNIRTFIGQGIGEYAHATARFDFTLRGFHAQVLVAGETYYIDPFNEESLDLYIVYSRKAFYANSQKVMASCDPQKMEGLLELEPSNQKLVENPKHINLSEIDIPISATTNGANLRTYRLALACTGEYASFHGGTVPLVMSAMTTSMNRVNGVFVKDMSLEMIMVANNDDLIFLNSGTDPYSNGNGSAMLSQNQTTCNSEIGSSNYDIGHVYSTGGGGVAYLQSVCGSLKAGGVTGQSSPVGDPFDIDYVAHEMGHQWGGNHTQNNSCNRSTNAAYEPGSASTIMGYAGICSPNLQSNSDDHFNNHSYNEMYNFSVNGSGNNCAVTTSSGNTPPTLTVRPSNFFIPIETPFELTATGNDVNGDALTFCWEQHNLGPATSSSDNNLTDPSGNAPIFRSWSPTTNETRVFPRLVNLVNNTSVIGELLPTYSRDITFRCTVRDNSAGGGGVTDDEVAFEAIASAGPFVLTSPNSGVSWVGNSTQTVTWNVANTNSAPVNCSLVDIFMSTDGGYTYPFQLATNVANDGSELVVVPNIATSQARIKVKASDNIFFDISNQNFSIQPGVVNDVDVALTSINEPSGNVCGSSVTPEITITNFGVDNLTTVDVFYLLSGNNSITYTWTGNLASNETATVTLSQLDVTEGNQSLSVILISPNGQADQNGSNNTATTSFDVTILTGEALPYSNDFEGSFPGTGWEIDNPDNDITWENTNISNDIDCNSSNVATINFYAYNDDGETDDLTSPLIDLNGSSDPEITFDYSYKRYSASFNDRMQVQIKSGCAESWTTIWDKANLVLATAGSQTSNYIPGCGDWESQSIDLSAYQGDIVQIRFRGITGYGNNLYLDNINVFSNGFVDCAGVIDGLAYEDECGVCDDIPANDNDTCLDCAGVPNGSAYNDECGVCDDIPANDNDTCLDCAGVPNGSAYNDECGVCDDIPANDNDTCLDCAGVPNGTAYNDECGVCDDIPANDNVTCLDCAGVPNGSAYNDECGVCDDIPANDNDTCLDCAGVPNGSAYNDECGVCDDIPANDNQTCLDCAGVPNGSAYNDECGVCDDIPANDNQTCLDCAGVPNGSAYNDECGVCDDIPTNDNQTCLDCAGVPNGSAYNDECGVCDDIPANDNDTCLDCAGVPNGSAYNDECGVCDDIPANDNDTCLDCAGVPNGSAYNDECGVCDDIPANDNDTCLDCAGVPNGSAYNDECGVCDDIPANDNQTCLDCAGVPNGSAYNDECGVCDDIPANDNDTCLDCAGVPNGSAYNDECGVCDDIPANDNDTCLDCAGVPNGSAYNDECGVCDDIPANDSNTCLDCAGVPNGSAYNDECGVCDDIPANDNDTCLDCAGVPNGSAYNDECGVCDDIPANDNDTCLDCAGVPNGSAYNDECGVCDDIPTNDNQTCLDCAGVPNGSAYNDECGVCDDIPANDNDTCLDCAGVPNGSAYNDECGVCDDIPANDNDTCLDCAGVPNGSAYNDECGVCDDIPANDNQTCLDCAGVPNGSASLDDCGTCTGGTTAIEPCIIGCMSPTSCNYNSEATVDDGSCIEPIENCSICNDSNDGLILIDGDQDGICDAEETILMATFEDDAPTCSSLDVEIWVYEANSSNLLNTLTSVLDDGTFSTELNLPEGTYDIYIKVDGFLSKGFDNTSIGLGDNNVILEGLILGDINGDDGINIIDFSILNGAFATIDGDPNYNPDADLNCDGGVNIVDVSILNQGFNLVGDLAALLNP